MHTNPKVRQDGPVATQEHQTNLTPILPKQALQKNPDMKDSLSRKLMGTISLDHLESRAGLLAIDTLIMTLTPAQEWLLHALKPNKNFRDPAPMRPLVLANDNKAGFN